MINLEKKLIALIFVVLLVGLGGGYGLGFAISQHQISMLRVEYNGAKAKYDELTVDYADLNETYRDLLADYAQLQSNYTDLNSGYTALNETYRDLLLNYASLNEENQILINNYAELSKDYTDLNRAHETLLSNYDNLSAEYATLQSTLETWEQLHIGTTLETYYDYVRANVVTLGGHPLGEEEWWSYPDYYEVSVEFAAHEAAHDAGNLYWSSLEEESHYYEYTGEYSYETSSRILQNVLLMSEINPYDDNATKIDRIMRFTGSVVSYEYKLIDHMWFPAETLAFRSGDCTSYSILQSALFEMLGIKSAIGFFENSEGEGHAMVLVHLDDLGEYGYWYYSDLTSYGLSAGKWIMIEPQYHSLSEQETNQDSWMPQWSILVAAEVDYGP